LSKLRFFKPFEYQITQSQISKRSFVIEPVTPNTFQQYSEPSPAPVIIDGEPEYEISKIVDSKIDRWRTCKLLYKIICLGYEDTDNDSEWLPVTELEHAKKLMNNFHLKYPAKPGPLRP